jgi:hypothetical protein
VSNEVTVLDPADPPGAPTNVTGVAGVRQVTVSWDAPASDGGAPITLYTVTSSGGQHCTTTGALTCTVTGLGYNVSYTFTVTATNAVGTSPASDPSATLIPYELPTAPRDVIAVASYGQAIVSWTVPTWNGGTAIVGYTVTSSGGQGCTTNGALTCTVMGLTGGEHYTFSVTATNARATGPAGISNEVTPGASAVRYSGDTPFAAAAAVSANTFAADCNCTVYIANYDSVPDALVAAAAAGAADGPLLYVGAGTPIDSYTTAELTRLDPSQIVVVGDANSISAAVLDALAPYFTP